jgi:hypothetical protein
MVPEEWPIAAPATDRPVEPACAAGSDRLSTVRRDFFLDPDERLTEQERALMTAMLHGLVADIADELWASLDSSAANDAGGPGLVRELNSAGLLDLPPLVRLLLRRAEQQQIASAVKARSGRREGRLLQRQVSDESAAVSAAAMALILARGRRQDRFGQCRIDFDDVPPQSAAHLVRSIAAAIARHSAQGMTDSLMAAGDHLIGRHGFERSLESITAALVAALHDCGRLSDEWIYSAAEEGEPALLGHALARRAGVSAEAGMDGLHARDGERLILLFRLAGVSRDCAAGVLASLCDLLRIADPARALASFDLLSEEEIERERSKARLPEPYREALAALGRTDGHGAV